MSAFLDRLRERLAMRMDLRLPEVNGIMEHGFVEPTVETDATPSDEDTVRWCYQQIAVHCDGAADATCDEPVLTVLEGLPPEQLSALIAWIQQGMTCRQIARMKGISEEEAFMRVAEVLKTLNALAPRDADT